LSLDKKSIKFTLGLEVLKGNSENIRISSDVEGKWQFLSTNYSRTEFKFSTSFLYIMSDEELKANKLNMELLVYHYLPNLMSFFIFTRPSYNQLYNLDYRIENGIGFKIDFLQKAKQEEPAQSKVCSWDSLKENSEKIKKCRETKWNKLAKDELSFSAAILWDNYQYSIESADSPIKDEIARLSFRLKGDVEIIDKLRLMMQVYYQPSFVEWIKDYRLLIKSEMSYDISPSLAFVLKLDGEYNSTFPAELGEKENWDWTLTNNIRLKLDL
jgi:hypothetical protein